MSAEARIGRLSLRAPTAFGAAARIATERRLQALDWQPPGMPPSGILLIRRIDDPLPGCFAPADRAFAAPSDWREALRQRLGRLYETAVRPRSAAAAQGADALYFSCLAELLARLAIDLAAGTGGWWLRPAQRSLADHGAGWLDLGARPRPAAFLGACPERLPAVAACLTQIGQAAAVFATFDAGETRNLLRMLAGEFSLPPSVVGDPATAPLAIGPPPAHTPPPTVALAATAAEVMAEAEAPWAEELASMPAAESLPHGSQALLGLALALHRHPLQARSRRFAAQADQWWRQTGCGTADRSASAQTPEPARREGPTPADARESPVTQAAANAGSATPRSEPADDTARTPHASTGTEPPGAVPRRPLAEEPEAQPPVADALRTLVKDAPTLPAEPQYPGERVVTRLGGVFYLIHCLDDLGIPGDPRLDWPVETTGAWGALRGFSRSLLADIGLPDADNDPIWDVIDALEPPLAPTAGPRDVRAPQSWPDQLADARPSLCWSAAQGRLRLWSDAGYCLADVASSAAPPADQARHEAAAFGVPPSQLRRQPADRAPLPPLHPALAPDLAPVVCALAPAVRRRLCLALGLPFDDREGLCRLVRVTATLCLGPSHIDLVSRLDQIWLPARRAGLDRDPGWRPDFGRVILFHFL